MIEQLTREEGNVLWSALEGYMEDMTICGADHPHGGEECDGWSPDEVAVLERAAGKIIEGIR